MSERETGKGLFSQVLRGDPDRHTEDYAPPSECFASTEAIRDSQALAYRSGKLFLGVIDGTVRDEEGGRHLVGGRPVGIEDDRHMLTVAGSRAGKGRAVIIPNMLHWPGSVLATDPKGELATITARQRARGLGQAVHVLDPFEIAKGAAIPFRAGFNPLAAMRPGSLVEDAALIADALVIVGGHDPHWDDSARNFIEGVVLHVCTSPAYAARRSLVAVQELVSKGGEDEEEPGSFSMAALEADMRRNTGAGGVVQTAAADFFDRPERERSSVLSTARRHLKFLNYPGIRSVVERHSFALDDLKGARPITIYLCLPARHMGTCSRWLRLFVNLALQAMERNTARPPAAPVLFCLDEFATLGKLQQIEDAAGQIAGFGVKLWPILQDLGQLKSLYGDRWETFMGNAGVLQFFGNNDLTTLDWISKRCDKTSLRSASTSSVTYRQSREGAGQGVSWRTEVHDLVTPGEAARHFGRDDKLLRQLVIWAGRAPLILQRAYYDQHELFKGQFDV